MIRHFNIKWTYFCLGISFPLKEAQQSINRKENRVLKALMFKCQNPECMHGDLNVLIPWVVCVDSMMDVTGKTYGSTKNVCHHQSSEVKPKIFNVDKSNYLK